MLAARAATAGCEVWDREAAERQAKGTGRRTAPRRGTGVARLACLFGAIGTLLLLYVAQQAWVISLTYRLNEAKATLHAAAVETDRLQLRASELSSPERIERVAREKLHLVAATPTAWVEGPARVALARPAEEGQPRGWPLVARLQRLLRSAPVQAAPAAE